MRRSPAIVAFLLSACAATRPGNLGLVDRKLSPCPTSPNCVSTQEARARIEPISYESSLEEARRRLVEVIRSMPRADVRTEGRDYVRAEFRSAVFGFVDDVEAYFDDEAKRLHLRSASRSGYSDLGMNRRRVERIRKRFLEAPAPRGK